MNDQTADEVQKARLAGLDIILHQIVHGEIKLSDGQRMELYHVLHNFGVAE